jgi:hypothetical protein
MDELSFPRPDDLTDAEWTALSVEIEAYADQRRGQLVAARTFAPHVVKHNVVEVDGSKRDTVTDCPDCTKGLIASGDALVCYDVLRSRVDISKLKTTHHDVIACGRH